MKQKKLIIFIPSIEGGGVEKNLFIIGNYLSNKIDKISLITSSKKNTKKFNNKIKLITPNNPVSDKSSRKFKYMICLFLLLKEIIKNRNIFVFSFQANFYCSIICKIFNIKIIIRSNSSPEGWSNNIIKETIFKNLFKLPNQHIVNSYKFKNELKKRFGIKAECIYNPLDKNEIKKKSLIKINDNFLNDEKTLKIINIGRFTDQKDQLTLLKATNILKKKIKFKLLIIGRGKNKEKIINYIKQNKLTKFIKIINYQKNPFPYLKKSNLFVLSSKYEGLPNVLLEALTLKKFIISSDCPTGPSEILDNGKTGLLFKVGDYKELAKKIIFFHSNKKICIKMMLIGNKRLKRFDHNLNLIKYFNIIKNYL
jgi:glycosyltransferase involved in cell wall biosynthesis